MQFTANKGDCEPWTAKSGITNSGHQINQNPFNYAIIPTVSFHFMNPRQSRKFSQRENNKTIITTLNAWFLSNPHPAAAPLFQSHYWQSICYCNEVKFAFRGTILINPQPSRDVLWFQRDIRCLSPNYYWWSVRVSKWLCIPGWKFRIMIWLVKFQCSK